MSLYRCGRRVHGVSEPSAYTEPQPTPTSPQALAEPPTIPTDDPVDRRVLEAAIECELGFAIERASTPSGLQGVLFLTT